MSKRKLTEKLASLCLILGIGCTPAGEVLLKEAKIVITPSPSMVTPVFTSSPLIRPISPSESLTVSTPIPSIFVPMPTPRGEWQSPSPLLPPPPPPIIISPSPPCLPSIKIMPDSLTLYQGNTNNLRAFVRDCKGNDIKDAKVKWESLDTSIAKVNTTEGVITETEVQGVEGSKETKIKAWYEGIFAQIPIQILLQPTSTYKKIHKIVYLSRIDGIQEIYVINEDGSNKTRLTNSAGNKDAPRWSPDGSKIFFMSNCFYVMNADGTNQIQLTEVGDDSWGANWSPNGTKIAFSSNRDGNSEIYVMNADGTNQTRLTNDPASDQQPKWSPDGTKITFSSTRDGNSEMYIMNAADGSNQTNLTNNLANEWYACGRWSPDGSKIAFYSDRTGNKDLYVMDPDGLNVKNLSDNPANEWYVRWSPNGSKIVFISNRVENEEIYVMNADGTNQTRLTTNAVQCLAPRWSPDGSKILFISNRDGGDSEIYLINSDGTGETILTTTTQQYNIEWSP